ncbi:hypothetical protein KY345_03890 [Candidatus Woesearchaeota archaeon]|nr:hypothetical protein [Candidatus Woesearchaeota archaeon]
MPDAQVVEESGIEKTTRELFGPYMEKTDSSFGMTSSELSSNGIKIYESNPLEFKRLNGVAVNFDFDKLGKNFVSVERNHMIGGFDIVVNRAYGDLGRVFGMVLMDEVDTKKGKYSLCLSSSELCRGMDRSEEGVGESYNELEVKIKDPDGNYIVFKGPEGNDLPPFRNQYAFICRNNHTETVHDIMKDVKGYISRLNGNPIDRKTLEETITKGEEKKGIIFREENAKTRNGQVGLVSKDNFFQIFCKGNEEQPCLSYTFYNEYNKDNIKEVSEELFQDAVYNILGKDSDIRIKLELISRVMRNKEKYDAARKIIPVKQPFLYHLRN